MYEEEDILYQIIRLRWVPENSLRDTPNHSGIAPEQDRERLPVTGCNSGEKRLVTNFRGSLVSIVNDNGRHRFFVWKRERGKAGSWKGAGIHAPAPAEANETG